MKLREHQFERTKIGKYQKMEIKRHSPPYSRNSEKNKTNRSKYFGIKKHKNQIQVDPKIGWNNDSSGSILACKLDSLDDERLY